MPIFEFDEFENSSRQSGDRRDAYNYWGYSTVGFFAPKAGYAATGPLGMQADELKTLVKELHKNGIEVMLDVVFNHTAEGDQRGPTISFRGLDNQHVLHAHAGGLLLQLQRLRQHAQLQQPGRAATWCSTACATGSPNTTSTASASTWPRSSAATRWACRWPTRRCWRRWRTIRSSADCKLVAEAWDAGGLYQVGSFPGVRPLGRVERQVPRHAPQVPQGRHGPGAAICRCGCRVRPTCTTVAARRGSRQLHHLPRRLHAVRHVAYNDKHNEANGEDNSDGANDNNSWNCGGEGRPTTPASTPFAAGR